jgi:hypothetical protein
VKTLNPEISGPSFEEFLEFLEKVKGFADVGYPDDELSLWNGWVDETPWWRWASLWCERRAGVLKARTLGFFVTQRMLDADVEDWKGPGRVLLSSSEDGVRRVYDFPDGTFKAYERAPEVVNEATGYKAQPLCWRQLEERPNVHLIEGLGEESIATAASRKGNEETAKLFSNADEEMFGPDPEPAPPASPFLPAELSLCLECFEEIEGTFVFAEGGGATHAACAPPAPPLEELVDRLKSEAALPTTDGRRSSANAPDPQAEVDTTPAGYAPRLKVACTNESCTTNMVMPDSGWERHRRACDVCGAPLMAWPVTAGRPCQTADLLEGRAKDGPWDCELCEKPAWMHVNYREGSPLSHADCSGFVRPAPANGSICKACLYVHAWDVSAPGVVNVCDSCKVEKKLVPYKGRSHLEELREKHSKKASETPSLPGKDCEGCGDPAEIQFARKGKGFPVIYACRPCSIKPEVKGLRRATMEI